MSNSTCFFVPAARFLRPGFAFWLRSPEFTGWRSAESRRVLARHPLGLHVTRQARRLTRRLASPYGGRSPPGAPPWRFWAPVPRFPHRNRFRIGHSELGRGSRASRGGGCESPPRDAT